MTANVSLYVTAGVLALAGLAMRILPIAPPTVARGYASPDAPAATSADRTGPGAISPTSGETNEAHGTVGIDPILSANIFSRSRVAPPRDRDVDDSADRRAPGPARAPARPTLYGTTTGPAGAVALIDVHGTPAGAQLYRVGDRIGNGRLAAIGDSTATVDGPTGTVVLRFVELQHRSDPVRTAASSDSAPPRAGRATSPVAGPVAAAVDTPVAASVDSLAQRIHSAFRRAQ